MSIGPTGFAFKCRHGCPFVRLIIRIAGARSCPAIVRGVTPSVVTQNQIGAAFLKREAYMKLIWLRIGTEILIGEVGDRFSVTALIGERTLQIENPMILQYANVQAPPTIHGKRPEMMVGFKLLPIPCSEIIIKDVSYAGVVDAQDPVTVTYYKIREALKEMKSSPLMVNQ